MRAEIFGSKSWTTTATGSGATVVIDLEEYATMAGELADIKAQLVALQNLLASHPPYGPRMDRETIMCPFVTDGGGRRVDGRIEEWHCSATLGSQAGFGSPA